MAQDVPRKPRGPYARGRQNREALLARAMEVIGQRGHAMTSLKEIAADVGMTEAGLLYHFGSKEQLLVEVLRRRDAEDQHRLGEPDGYPRTVQVARHNMQVPGLMQLFVSLAAAARDPEHVAHDYFLEHDHFVFEGIRDDIAARQQAGTIDPAADPALLARVLIALTDGLQMQWSIDPTINLLGTLERFWDELVPRPTPPVEH